MNNIERRKNIARLTKIRNAKKSHNSFSDRENCYEKIKNASLFCMGFGNPTNRSLNSSGR